MVVLSKVIGDHSFYGGVTFVVSCEDGLPQPSVNSFFSWQGVYLSVIFVEQELCIGVFSAH